MEEEKVKDKVEYEGKEYEVKYLREARYGKRGELTVAYIELDDDLHLIIVAERSPVEKYNEARARGVSLGRLQKKIKKRKKQKEIALKKRITLKKK